MMDNQSMRQLMAKTVQAAQAFIDAWNELETAEIAQAKKELVAKDPANAWPCVCGHMSDEHGECGLLERACNHDCFCYEYQPRENK